VPLLVASMMGLVIFTWVTGRKVTAERTREQGVAMADLAGSLTARPPMVVEGTAVFLTQDLTVAPSALLHNLKHNKALHRSNILLRFETTDTPSVEPGQRLELERLDERFALARLRYGYMDGVDVPSDLARHGGSDGDSLLSGRGGTSFFVGRSAIRFARKPVLPRWMTVLYMFLHRNAADPTAWFAIPPNRVVELGSQIEL